jgi:uncharacterized ion transporter superfamily protein YfcC
MAGERKVVTAFFFGSRGTIAGTVYGTIIVLAVLAAGANAYRAEPWHLVVIVVTTVLVLWLAHVYAHGLEESLAAGRRLSAAELEQIARHQLAIPAAAVAPTTALVLGALGVFRESTAVWIAFTLGVVTLGVQGVRYAAVERMNGRATIVAVALNLALGLALVALEVFVSH